MRLWNALIPTVLLPIVAADFHVLITWCGNATDRHTEPGGPDWIFLPSGQDTQCENAVVAQSPSFFDMRTPFGSDLTAAPCGCNVTISDELDRWWITKDGKSTNGPCYPVTYRGGTGNAAGCITGAYMDGSLFECFVFDVVWCKSPDDQCNN
ncbi:uncharacterized protein EI90DRAFT_1758493 [Cantharellus anzutake]|uniref:uncharacterized protein n=1 Tax=Cantharellus anzutake TaxID=1750568 RepID=UPI001904971C|nr:uncharacterized protein EI90DRAFT_1758493 [Cantharellus anzutake]KAF8341604.1 hypothetical protein EI90DRAFT_1758493 [Cantharellus anzutake]